jgi:glycerophosphodiester phosphodiesterase
VEHSKSRKEAPPPRPHQAELAASTLSAAPPCAATAAAAAAAASASASVAAAAATTGAALLLASGRRRSASLQHLLPTTGPALRSVASSAAAFGRAGSSAALAAPASAPAPTAPALPDLLLRQTRSSARLVAMSAVLMQQRGGGGGEDGSQAAAAADGSPAAIQQQLPTARVAAAAAAGLTNKAAAPPATTTAAFSTASSTAAPVDVRMMDEQEDDAAGAVTSPPPPTQPVVAAAATTALPPPLFFAPSSASGQIAIGGHRGMGMNVLLAAAAQAAAAAEEPQAFDYAATATGAGSAAPAVAAATALGSAPTATQAAALATATALPPNAATAGAFFISPAWRENTVSSMRAAANAGASFVEFDVQVTADGHAVLWHDERVEYGDPAEPDGALVGDLTLAEFRALGSLTASGAGERLSVVRSFWTHGSGGSSGSESDGAAPPSPAGGAALASASSLARAAALGAAAAAAAAPPPSSRALSTAAVASALANSSGTTDAPSASGLSSSSTAVGAAPPRFKSPHRRWRCRHEEPFPALDEVFRSLPPSVGFNIEVKMATPSSLARTPDEEIERVVGPVLATVERCLAEERAAAVGGDASTAAIRSTASSPRMVVFSSFDPDVCAALRARAGGNHPVCLLSTGPTELHADPRRTSLPAALTFAASAGLAGVVVDSTALSRSQETVAQARELGLAVMTYGGANGDPRWVAQQQALGVHAAIVDDVEGVLRGLAVAASQQQAMAVDDGGDAVMAAEVA